MDPAPESRRFQFSLASLLVAQAVVSLTLGVWKGFGAPLVIAILVLGTMFTLTVVGTVWIARDWGRSVQVAKVGVWVALVVLAAVILLRLATWNF
jgi:hypothetical protein